MFYNMTYYIINHKTHVLCTYKLLGAAEFTEGYEFHKMVLILVCAPRRWHCNAKTCRSKGTIM